jgi:hypothetical protein
MVPEILGERGWTVLDFGGGFSLPVLDGGLKRGVVEFGIHLR